MASHLARGVQRSAACLEGSEFSGQHAYSRPSYYCRYLKSLARSSVVCPLPPLRGNKAAAAAPFVLKECRETIGLVSRGELGVFPCKRA